MSQAIGAARHRLILMFLITAVAALLPFAARASAAPAVQAMTGDAAGPTPNIQRGQFTIFDQTATAYTTGSAGTINFTLDGTPYVGYCIDTSRKLSTTPEAVEVTTEAPPTTVARRALAWVLINQTPTGPDTPAKRQLAAAAQVATWLLVDPRISQTAPTDDAALNAAGIALVQKAKAATATPKSLTLSAPLLAPGTTSATISISGRPGAVVTLSVVTGAGSLSTQQVTLGPNGDGSVVVTASGPGTVAVSASTAGDGRLLLIEPTGSGRAQPTAAATPSTISATANVLFQAATPAPAPGPAVQGPVVVTPSVAPKLGLSKIAPPRSAVLKAVKYTIEVRNSSSKAARNVVLRDRLPAGMSFVRSSQRGTLRSGSLVFNLGTIAGGATRTVSVWLQADAGVRGTRVNVATVTATQFRTATARAATLFRPLKPVRVQPAVTG